MEDKGLTESHSGPQHDLTGRITSRSYRHLFDGHEVSTLADTFEDLSKLWVYEGII